MLRDRDGGFTANEHEDIRRYRMIHLRLRQQGWAVNLKRVRRLYRQRKGVPPAVYAAPLVSLANTGATESITVCGDGL